MDAWNPTQYERFKNERSQPFLDLMALVEPAPAMSVVDLGCGTGELTALLHDHLKAKETLGTDSSDAMLAKAAAFARPGLAFKKLDIRESKNIGAFDLVFSNAALQWVDDHPTLLRELAGRVKPGGQLAVQIPANHDHPSHVIAARVAQEPEFQKALGGYVRQSPVLAPEAYAELLYELGFQKQSVRLQVYLHILPSADGVIEWVKGTLLTDYEKRLGSAFPAFLKRYREVLLPELSKAEPYPYPFKRILFWARKTA